MKTTFYILLNIKTAEGFERYGRFELGGDRRFAYGLFEKLAGREAREDGDILHMDLMEARDGLPVNIRVISCTAEELARNCKCITKEIFKLKNLDETMP